MNKAERPGKTHTLVIRVLEHHRNPWVVQGGKDPCGDERLAENGQGRFHYDVLFGILLLVRNPYEDLRMGLSPNCLRCTQSKILLSLCVRFLAASQGGRQSREARERHLGPGILEWLRSHARFMFPSQLRICPSEELRIKVID